MNLTASQIRALTILARHGPMAPADFAQEMWPDSSGWQRVHKCGAYGASRGVMMAMVGGGYLGKLRKMGLSRWAETSRRQMPKTCISDEGRVALREAKAKS